MSRDHARDSRNDETDPELVALAEKQMAERAASSRRSRKAAEKQAAKIKENKWVLPLASYGITATFGQYGLWASYHTGLDFNANTGDRDPRGRQRHRHRDRLRRRLRQQDRRHPR